MQSLLGRNGTCLIESLETALSFGARLVGLLGRRELGAGRALYIPHCSSIHTFFMRFNLDLLFVGSDLEVVRIVRNVTPWRIVFGGMKAAGVIELESGFLPPDAVTVGDRLMIAEASSFAPRATSVLPER